MGKNKESAPVQSKIKFEFKKVKLEEDEPYPDFSRPSREECF